MCTLKLDAKKKYIEALFAIITLIFVFVSDIESKSFYYCIFAVMAASIGAITFLNLERGNPETRIVWDIVFCFCSLILAISFSLVFSYIFYLKTLYGVNGDIYLPLYGVISSGISIYIFIVLTAGLGSDIRYSVTRLNPCIGSGFDTVKFLVRLVRNLCLDVLRKLLPKSFKYFIIIFISSVIIILYVYIICFIMGLIVKDYTPTPSVKQVYIFNLFHFPIDINDTYTQICHFCFQPFVP